MRLTVIITFSLVLILLFYSFITNDWSRPDLKPNSRKLNQNQQHNNKRFFKSSIETKVINEAQSIDISSLPDEFKKILGFDKESYRTRLFAIYNLSLDLSDAERDILYYFLRNDDNSMMSLHLKDEVMRKLEQQLIRPKEYEQRLIEITLDKRLDGGLRGYAVQHLRSAYDVKTVNKIEVREGLYNALGNIHSDVAGTAILALTNLHQKYKNDFDVEQIKGAAISIASDESTQMASKLTAVECCARLGIKEVLPVARAIVNNPKEPVAHKLPAVNAIGQLGDISDESLLLKLQNDKYLSVASRIALSRIRNKVSN